MAQRTKRRTTKRKTTRRTPQPMPTPASGEQFFLLDLPFGMRHPQVTYRKDLRRSLYVGATLPDELADFAAQPYSYEAWLQDSLNGEKEPTIRGKAAPKKPRTTQIEDATAIVEAAAAGRRGFYVGNGTGTGKTITALLAAKAICHLRGGSTVLITVDRPAAMTKPMFRNTIAAIGDGGLRWIIASCDGDLKRLIGPGGHPKITPDVLICDEAHVFKNPSQRTSRMRRLAHLDQEPTATTPFLIAMTATPGHSPAEYLYLSALLAEIHGEPAKQWADLGARLKSAGLPLEKTMGRWGWNAEAKENVGLRDKATITVRDWMLNTDPPVMLNRQPAWGDAQLEALPVDLTPEQRRLYNAEWGDFQREMKLARTGKDKARGLAAITRLRQQASLLRIDSTVERVVNDLDNGYQVVVGVEHVTTAAEPLATEFAKRNIPVAHLYGGRGDIEEQRLRFQRGEAPVSITNTTTSISLHSGEHLPDGGVATMAERRGIFHQAMYSGIRSKQLIGRTHRDGQRSDWFLTYGVGTIEERAAELMIGRMANLAVSVDSDRSTLESIAALFGAAWLPVESALGSP